MILYNTNTLQPIGALRPPEMLFIQSLLGEQWQLIAVLVLLVSAVVMFMRNTPRMDAVALIMIAALPFTGVLSMAEALGGFSDSNIVLIALLFVLGEGLARTGVARQVGDFILRKAGTNETKLIIWLMMSVGILGAVMSSTAVVAIFIPVVMRICRNAGIAPSRLMMPLSMAALISGMMTLVATAPNLIVDAELIRQDFDGFGFFDISPFGFVILLCSVLYMLVARRWLPNHHDQAKAGEEVGFNDWIKRYGLADKEMRVLVETSSALVGKNLDEIQLRGDGINLLAIERMVPARKRQLKFTEQRRVLQPTPGTVLHANDVLLLDVQTSPERRDELVKQYGVSILPLKQEGSYLSDYAQDIGMVEAVITAESRLIGQTILDARMRSGSGITVIGLRRGQEIIDENLLHEELKVGDTLLITGFWNDIKRARDERTGLLPLQLPKELEDVLPAADKAPMALAILAAVVFAMVAGLLPNVHAVLIGVLLMGLFGIVDMPTAYGSISWKSLILIVGMMPFSLALQRTGGVDMAADALLALLGEDSPRLAITLIFGVTAILGMFISNTATAILMAPVALKLAADLGTSPYPFAMTVALAASTAFMTPVSSPVNTLVVVPGSYSFGDFLRVGVPFSIIVWLVSVLMVPFILPF